MKRLTGLVIEIKDTKNNIWSSDWWQCNENEPISKMVKKEINACKKRGWRIVKIHKYWAE